MNYTVWSVVEEYFELQNQLSSAKSCLGAQLDMLRDGLTGGVDEFTRNAKASDRFLRYRSLVKMWAALTPEEQRVVLRQHTPVGQPERYEREVMDAELKEVELDTVQESEYCDAMQRDGKRCRRKRLAGKDNCGFRTHRHPKLVVRMTRAGEEFARASETEGYVVVWGWQNIYPTVQQIASALNWQSDHVSRLLASANGKIAALLHTLEE